MTIPSRKRCPERVAFGSKKRHKKNMFLRIFLGGRSSFCCWILGYSSGSESSDDSVPAIAILTQHSNSITATSPTEAWSPSQGTVSENTITIDFGGDTLTGTREAGGVITWSPASVWTPHSGPGRISLNIGGSREKPREAAKSCEKPLNTARDREKPLLTSSGDFSRLLAASCGFWRLLAASTDVQ